MSEESCEIVIPSKITHQLKWLLETTEGQDLLALWHPRQKRQRLHCACNPAALAPPEMVIRLRKSGGYYVARMPETGHRHAAGKCPFFAQHPDTSGGGEYKGAIQYHEDHSEIAVNFPLRKAEPITQAKPDSLPHNTTGRVIRYAMGLGGLLSHLWSEAGLNDWRPGTIRPWNRVHSMLQTVSEATRLGARNLHEYLYIQQKGNVAWLPTAPVDVAQSQDYFLLLFKIDSVSITPFNGVYLKVSNSASLLMKAPERKSMQLSYPRIWPYAENRSAAPTTVSGNKPTVICFALVQWETIKHKPQLVVTRAACMLTNWRFIPVESSYELKIADLLVHENRNFSKPLRYDAAQDVVFPDFILNDAGSEGLPMEVYGVTCNALYDQRKQAKRFHYQNSGRPHWEWTPDETMQPFPPIMFNASH